MDFENIDKATFLAEKEELRNYAVEQLNKSGRTKDDIESLIKLIKNLDDYTYENRLSIRGLMTYLIIDSLDFDDHSLSDRFLAFDDYPARRNPDPMDRIKYQTRKDKLRRFAMEQLNRATQTKDNIESLTVLIKILNEHAFSDRLDMAGLIRHLIRNSLKFDDKSIAERFLAFAQSIQ